MVTLRELREREGYSQSDLAEKLGVDRATVSRWETPSGWGVEPSRMARLALAQVFSVDPESIEFGADAPRARGRPRKPAG